jgi:hypothetical protein
MNEPTKVCSRKDCPHGGAPQPLANFYRDRSRADGRHCYCKVCQGRLRDAWDAAHPEQVRAAHRRAMQRWYHADPEQAKARINAYGRRRDTPDGVQRATVYMRRYRARKRAAKEQTT